MVVRNGDFGIFMEADRNQLRGNRSIRDGVAAIQVGPGSRNVIAGNRIRGGGEGIGIEKGRGNVVARNVVVGVRHDGIRLGMWDPPIGSTRTVVRRNLVIDSGRDGFRVAQRDRRCAARGQRRPPLRGRRLRHRQPIGEAQSATARCEVPVRDSSSRDARLRVRAR